MTVSSMHHVQRAESNAIGMGTDTVSVWDDRKARFDIFLPAGTGQSVADAINAAVQPADTRGQLEAI